MQRRGAGQAGQRRSRGLQLRTDGARCGAGARCAAPAAPARQRAAPAAACRLVPAASLALLLHSRLGLHLSRQLVGRLGRLALQRFSGWGQRFGG